MNRIVKLSLLLSVVLHAMFVAVLYFQNSEQPKPQAKPVVVELAETAPPISQTSPSEPKRGSTEKMRRSDGTSSSNSKVPMKLATRDFGLNSQTALRERWQESGDVSVKVGPKSEPSQPPGSDPMKSLAEVGQGWSKGVQYGQAMDIAFTNETLNFFDSLHRKIDSTLVFPEDFVKARMKGKVRVEAIVSKDGTLLELPTVRADNDLLHAYVTMLLIHRMSEPLPPRAHLKTERAVVAFDFDFRIRVEGQNPTTLISGVQKNHLRFAREGVVDPIVNEKIQEIFTHYIPPIIVFPGGVYVDFILAYQYIKNLAENAPLESEERAKRLKLLHQELRQTIHSTKDRKPAPFAPLEEVGGS